MADASIYRQFLQPVRSVQDYGAEMDQNELRQAALEGARRQNALQALTVRQQMEEKNALARLAQANQGNQEGFMSALEGSGMPGLMSQGQAMRKQALERRKAEAEADKLGAEASGLKQKNSEAMRRDAVHQAASFSSPEDAIASMNMAVRDGKMPMQVASAMQRMISSDPQWQLKLIMGANSPEKLTEFLMPHLQTVNAGGFQVNQAINKLTGVPTETGRTPITQSADNAATQLTARRGQDLTDQRARDFNATKVEENNIKRAEVNQTKDLTKTSQLASFDTMLGTLDRLANHPGLAGSVGLRGAIPTLPGTDAANFQAELNTFQSQAFLPMVAQLKGMGALSDAEGKKLTAAVGALDPRMGEKAIRESIARITEEMQAAKDRVAGVKSQPKDQSKRSSNTNAKGWVLHTDAAGNKAYVSPDGKQFEEVK